MYKIGDKYTLKYWNGDILCENIDDRNLIMTCQALLNIDPTNRWWID